MGCLTWTGLIIAAAWACAYRRAPLPISTGVVGAALLLWAIFGGGSWLWKAFILLGYAAVMAPLNMPEIRKQYITGHAFAFFKKALPAMSATEREAMEAGSVWWDGDLFSGDPDFNRLKSFPDPVLSAEERAFLDGPVEELCRTLDDWRITDELHDLPPEAWKFIKENGFFGLIIPKEYGGLGFSAFAHSEVVMKIASRGMAAAVTVMVPNSLGPAELLLHYGTKEQKGHYLPRLARGEDTPCFALTGPQAGSDAASMPDAGVVCKGEFDGKTVTGILLNFDKRYITLAPVATLVALAFKMYDPEKLLGGKEDIGITVALLPADTPGMEIGARHDPLGIPFMNGPVRGKDVFIPVDYIVGGPKMAGKGWTMLMERLAIGRSISLPALSVAAGKIACRWTGAYARVRLQFKLPIARFEGIEEKLASIAGLTYLMNATRIMTVGAVDMGERPAVVSAIAKYNLTEYMRRIIIDAMDVHGGSGIIMGPRNLLGNAYKALPISITVEGANILTRTLIVFGQGAIRCHPYVLKQMAAAQEKNQIKALDDFDGAFFGHLGFTIGNAARALFMGLTGAVFAMAPPGPLQRRMRRIKRFSAAFALAADMAMFTLGGALKKKESISGRFADALSHLYMASAVARRFDADGRPEEDVPLALWAMDHSLYVVQERLAAIIDNLPMRPAAWLLSVLIFPLGGTLRPPADRLGHQAASILGAPSEARDRLTRGIFHSANEADASHKLEDAFRTSIKSELSEKKLSDAVKAGYVKSTSFRDRLLDGQRQGVISMDEGAAIQKMEELRREALAVDEFPPERFRGR
jgi:acyl-CoA dehydrogenase